MPLTGIIRYNNVRMKKFWIQTLLLTAIITGAFYVFSNQNILQNYLPTGGQQDLSEIRINETSIKIEVADTQLLRTKGLSGRDSLASDSGMLFIFPSESKYRFWMKGMKFPLDMIFIKGGKVVDIIKNIPPPIPGQKDSILTVYEPIVPIDMLLEVNAGFAGSSNIQVGDNVFLIK